MSQDDSQSLLARVTTDGIIETAVKKSVDFIVRLGERPDMGRNIYKQLFPKSKDKAKLTTTQPRIICERSTIIQSALSSGRRFQSLNMLK